MGHKAISAAVGIVLGSLLSASAVAGPATVLKSNEKVDLAIAVFVPCANGGAGEFVLLEGPLHVNQTLTMNDNHYSFSENNNPQGIKGLGQITGDAYNAVGKTSYSFNFDIDDSLPTVFTYVNRFHVVGPGPGNDFYVKQTEHLTINANGEITAERSFDEVTCK
jgi:hypothetical protein